jgi:DNA-binding NtrC family response regulator
MLIEEHFVLALINGIPPASSVFELANRAAYENTSVLFLSDHPDFKETLNRFGYPYLEKPFSLDALMANSAQAINQAAENISRVKASAAKMNASIDALRATFEETRRLIGKSMS